MKSNLYPGVVITAVLVCLGLLGGCQQAQKRSLMAKYIVPPDVVRDVSSIQNLAIAPPRVVLSGRYGKRSELRPVFVNCLNQRLASGIYRERFFNVQDEIHGNARGLGRLDKTFAKAHGYSIKPARLIRRAEIRTRANVSLTRSTGKDRMVTSLASIPYSVQYSDDGVPYSVPNYDGQVVEEHVSQVPFVKITAKGDLRVEVRDNQGRVVYEKTFKNLSFEKKVGGDNPAEALPTVLEIASSLFDASIAEVVRDISPHKVERTLYVNEDGDPTAVALIKATAFSEAYKRLSFVLEENGAAYAREAKEIKEDFAEKIQAAQAADAGSPAPGTLLETLRMEKKTALLEAGLFRSPDFENMAIVCEAMGITNEALDFYKMAAGADPANSAAASALARVSKLADKVLTLPGQIKGVYEEEENKER
ncbi:hypothetical protein [Desulfoplanes sp.]